MPDAAFKGLTRIAQIAINAKDLDRAAAFYRDALGLEFLFAVLPKMAFFRAGDVRLMVALPERPEFDHPSSILYFEVPDMEEAHRVLSSRGVQFVAPPQRVHSDGKSELWLAFFHDTEGNLLALSSNRAVK